MHRDPAESVALFRYGIVAEATNPRLSATERGQLVRALARRAHPHPDGGTREYARGTLDRWVRAYREQGLDGLRPRPRTDLGAVRRHQDRIVVCGTSTCRATARSPSPPTASASPCPIVSTASSRWINSTSGSSAWLRRQGVQRPRRIQTRCSPVR